MQVDELHITNFVDTGLNTAFSRYTFAVLIKWTDNAGGLHSNGPTTYTFPNDLAAMPLAVRRRFAKEMITATVRVALGLDQWSQYSD